MFRSSFLLFCYVLWTAAAQAQKVDPATAGMNPQRLALIPDRMQQFVSEGKTSGVVTILARHGQTVSFEAVGYKDLERKEPMQKDTMFRIASMTKPATCAAIMVLVDEGRISVIDPIGKYLPEYKELKINTCSMKPGYGCGLVAPSRPVNIEDLMTHTSGLPGSVESNGSAPGSLAELVSQGAKARLLFEPGTNWSYSNLGIDILGRIVEVVSGQDFETFLHDRIFLPLGMTDTYFFVPSEKQHRIATLYSYTDGKLVPAPIEYGAQRGPKIPIPAGGLVSTAEDMLRFNQMMRNKGVLNGHRVLSNAATTLMTISHTRDLKVGFAPGVGHGYGYEVVRDTAGMFRYNSIGSYVKGGAYRTYEWVDPEKDLVGVILMQLTNGGGDVADEINSFMQLSAAAIEQ